MRHRRSLQSITGCGRRRGLGTPRHPKQEARWTKAENTSNQRYAHWVSSPDHDGGQAENPVPGEASDTRDPSSREIKGEANPFDRNGKPTSRTDSSHATGSLRGRGSCCTLVAPEQAVRAVRRTDPKTRWHLHHLFPVTRAARMRSATWHCSPELHRQLHANGWKLDTGSL